MSNPLHSSEQIAQVAHEAAAAYRRIVLPVEQLSTGEFSWEKLTGNQRQVMVTLVDQLRESEDAEAFIRQADNEDDQRNNSIILGVVWAMTLETAAAPHPTAEHPATATAGETAHATGGTTPEDAAPTAGRTDRVGRRLQDAIARAFRFLLFFGRR